MSGPFMGLWLWPEVARGMVAMLAEQHDEWAEARRYLIVSFLGSAIR